MHRFYLGIGSNLGDRQANILTALQRLRAQVELVAVSAFYESPPAEGAEGPAFLNLAVEARASLDRQGFEAFARRVELSVGRASARPLAARSIDIDVLVYDGVAHPRLAERWYVLVPLAEIAPDFVDERTGRRLADLAAAYLGRQVHRRERALHFSTDRQDESPEVRLSLNRAGVAKVRRIVHLNVDGRERVYSGEFSMVADLAPDKSGVHMSRFAEILEEATLDVLSRSDAPERVERLVAAVAHEIVSSQRAVRADVRLRADFGLERWTPVSGKRGEETYTLLGIAHADEAGARCVIGVEAEGMTACPCAQGMMREHSLRELLESGFDEATAQRALDALPVATHNQRGRGALLIGVTDDAAAHAVRAEDLVEIVESSMSSETYDLLKRPDEFFVVNKAHHNPKFVEDVVRGILARSLDVYSDLGEQTFLFASQVNYESIHKHDAFAEGFGTFGEFRRELREGRRPAGRTDLAAWLGTRPSRVIA
ncbi:MAG: GTP cyclohydrolase MptA [Vulcanimicrobiaceae bacterium]